MGMTNTAFMKTTPPKAPVLLAAAACIAALDMSFAVTFWSIHGVAPLRVLQSVASGLMGRAAFGGGVSTAMLGLALHCLIALLMVLAYDGMAVRVPWLLRHPWRAGPAYGCLLYLCMTYIVLPLSAARAPSSRPDWIIGSVLSHVLLVGLPCAWFVRAAHPRTAR